MWSDEATFSVTGSHVGKVRLRRGSDPLHPKYTQSTLNHPNSVMVWAAYGYYCVGKFVVRDKNLTVNLELFCDHLESCFEACQSDFFYAGWCTCTHGKDYQGMARLLPGGLQKGLNPVKNLWAITKRRSRRSGTALFTTEPHHVSPQSP